MFFVARLGPTHVFFHLKMSASVTNLLKDPKCSNLPEVALVFALTGRDLSLRKVGGCPSPEVHFT